MYIHTPRCLALRFWAVVHSRSHANNKDCRLKGLYWLICLHGINKTKRVRHLHADNLPRSYWRLIWIGDRGCPGGTCAIGQSWRKMTRDWSSFVHHRRWHLLPSHTITATSSSLSSCDDAKGAKALIPAHLHGKCIVKDGGASHWWYFLKRIQTRGSTCNVVPPMCLYDLCKCFHIMMYVVYVQTPSFENIQVWCFSPPHTFFLSFSLKWTQN